MEETNQRMRFGSGLSEIGTAMREVKVDLERGRDGGGGRERRRREWRESSEDRGLDRQSCEKAASLLHLQPLSNDCNQL